MTISLPVYERIGGVLVQTKFALIDDNRTELVGYRWRIDKHGYVCRKTKARRIYLHHCILPHRPDGLVRDHINRDKLDNRLGNLRLVTRAASSRNRGPNTNRGTGVRGVNYINGQSLPWRASIQSGGEYIFYKNYATKEEATAAISVARALLMPESTEDAVVECAIAC